MAQLLPALLLLICADLLQASKYFHLKEKTLIVDVHKQNGKRKGETVTVECNTSAYTDAAIDSKKIHWNKNGHKGNTLTVQVSERPDSKNYTCKLENSGIIDYTHIVIHEMHQPFFQKILNVKNPIRCIMKNYNGHFTCSWNGTRDPNTEFFFEALNNRNNTTVPCESIKKHTTEENVIPSYTVTCHDTQICNYSEDHSFFVMLHVLDMTRYEEHHKFFTLQNIIKPDPPQNLHINMTDNSLFLQWNYPKTWCNARLFYPLIFNVKVERKGSPKAENHPNVHKEVLPVNYKDVTQFCVQARDMFHVDSHWSNWSCSKKEENTKTQKTDKDKKKKKNKKKGKKKQNGT
ncbi:interleukin-12 subunit beta [Anomaloglossus baeobatrachus]|uniref:interleukin-12 subunit beta n=1 Tax=Anomaloglossus baeobatrachus TaxID=238106 RepID=UPI003F505709